MNLEAQRTIEEKFSRLQDYISKLSSYLSLSDKEILSNEDKILSVERLFQLVVDESIDINAVIVFQLSGKVPDSYKSTFFELVPLGVIEQSFAESIADSAKIRNQLTHDYEKLSRSEIISKIRTFFELYKSYIKIIAERNLAFSGK